ncbi:molybdopterin molybdenumtransferase MoeA [Kocuria tytonis]|uniref:Molybdopterin molybdenumtransferase n=2 Tax=Kocuria tytonis TaxID=2054280 RepID=A0A495A2U1_9MICC|nr:molybdopterin molybdenumtransferase MoeA [Kocuria tytonis]
MPGLPHPHDPSVREDEDQPQHRGETPESTVRWAQWDEARRLAYGVPQPLPNILLPLAQCLDETLAESVTAEMPVPHYASAAEDGWAVAGEGPWRIRTPQPAETDERLLLTLPPDRRMLPVVELTPGEATHVNSGDPVPYGTRALLEAHRGHVVPADPHAEVPEGTEHGRKAVEGDTLEDATPAAALVKNQGVRAVGEEIEQGDLLLRAGRRLNPVHLGLAASAGHDMLPVRRRPRVTVLLGFTNMVEDGIPGPGEVRDSLGLQLPAVLRELGANVDQVRRVADGSDGMVHALTESPMGANSLLDARVEMVVTTGGTGHGEDDHVRQALEELDAHLILDGVAQEPAHGVILAQLPDDGPVVLALPGSPLSAMTGLLTVGHALIAGATGETLPLTRRVTAGRALEPTGHTRVIPAYIQDGRVIPEPAVGPAMLSGLAHADVLLVVPEDGMHAGQDMEVVPLPWRA